MTDDLTADASLGVCARIYNLREDLKDTQDIALDCLDCIMSDRLRVMVSELEATIESSIDWVDAISEYEEMLKNKKYGIKEGRA